MDSLINYSNSPEETLEIGKKIAKKLTPGSVVALSGELGSGKTCFTKGIAEGLGITERITSPTYTIVNEYEINFNHEPHEPHENILFYHIDTYRLNNEDEFINIGGKEILESNGIIVVEWSDKIKNLLPENTIKINFEIIDSESRKITIKGMDTL